MIAFIVNGVFLINYRDIISSRANVDFLSEHTVNTWQADRGADEKKNDTQLGKLAEDAVSTVLRILGIEQYHSYDEFRSDNFEMHAPFDGLLCEHLSDELVNTINQAVKQEGNKLSPKTRDAINAFGARTIEIKSTRLAQKYKKKAKFVSYGKAEQLYSLIESLKGLDFLTYPFFTRYGDFTFPEYCDYVNKKHLHRNVSRPELEKMVADIERDNSADIYIRVFMDEECKKAIIMGWIDRKTFFENPQTHKLILPGKSEVPLYFVKSIKKGYPISFLKKTVTIDDQLGLIKTSEPLL